MKPDLILIAASAGGPPVLRKIVSQISANINVPVLIVQHMPSGFTGMLAESMNRESQLTVVEASHNEKLEPAKVYIAPGGFHLAIDSGRYMPKIKILDTETVNHVKPAADVLFKNVADEYAGKNIVVVVATGMGKDGMRGVEYLKQKCNCYCITESEGSCTIYGMPKAVDDAGLSDESLDANHISKRINALCEKGW